MPKDFQGIEEGRNIAPSEAGGGSKKTAKRGTGWLGESEDHLARSQADGKSKSKGGPPKAKPDTYGHGE
jgi:hypothetical protein